MHMIFVSTGTFPIPFSRLIETVINYYQDKPNYQVVIQSGVMPIKSSPKHITTKSYFSYKETLRLYKKAELNISAAGEATALLLLKHSKNIPILFPRLKRYSEHVDDIQLQTCKYLRSNKLAETAITTNQLTKKISETVKPNQAEKILTYQSKSFNKLIANLTNLTNNL